MKTKLFSIFLTLFFLSTFYLPNSFAQDSTQWNLPEGAKARLGKGSINDIAYSPDGSRLAVGSDIGIWVYDARTGAEVALIGGPTASAFSVAFSPDGNTIASAGRTVQLWEVTTGTLINTLTGDIGPVVAFSPDGNTLATGSWGNTAQLWDAATGTLKNTLIGHTDLIFSVAFSPDGNTLATGSQDDTVRLWNTATGTLKNTLIGHTWSILSIAFSPDGNTIATGSF